MVDVLDHADCFFLKFLMKSRPHLEWRLTYMKLYVFKTSHGFRRVASSRPCCSYPCLLYSALHGLVSLLAEPHSDDSRFEPLSTDPNTFSTNRATSLPVPQTRHTAVTLLTSAARIASPDFFSIVDVMFAFVASICWLRSGTP